MMRKLTDKSNCICQKNILTPRQFQQACRRIQCCKKLVFFQNTGIRQRIEQRGLAGIGITDDRRNHHLVFFSFAPYQLTVLLHLDKFCLKL